MNGLSMEERMTNIESMLRDLLSTNKEVFTLAELSIYTGLSKSYLYKLTSGRRIPCYKPHGKHIYFRKEEINDWLLQNRIKTNEEIDVESSSKLVLKR